jgi:hypothetical protein
MADDAPQPTREQQLEQALRKLLVMTQIITDQLGLDTEETALDFSARSVHGDRPLGRVTLAEVFAEADRLLGPTPQT